MLPNISTVLLSQKLFSQKRLISEVTKLLKYLDFKLHLNSKISVLHRFCSWASSSKCAQTGGRLKELGFKVLKDALAHLRPYPTLTLARCTDSGGENTVLLPATIQI